MIPMNLIVHRLFSQGLPRGWTTSLTRRNFRGKEVPKWPTILRLGLTLAVLTWRHPGPFNWWISPRLIASRTKRGLTREWSRSQISTCSMILMTTILKMEPLVSSMSNPSKRRRSKKTTLIKWHRTRCLFFRQMTKSWTSCSPRPSNLMMMKMG